MRDADRARMASALEELCRSVGADGAALYVDDGDGVLSLAATARQASSGGKAPGFIDRLRGGVAEKDGRTIILDVPGTRTGFVVVSRRGGADFTQQDRTVAGLYLRRLVDDDVTVLGHYGGTGWTRQLETIQRIAARLTRLASVEEVGATICTETRQVIDYTEAQVLVASGYDGSLRVVAAAGAAVGPTGTLMPLPNHGAGGEAIARAALGGVPVLASDLPDLGPGRPGPCTLLAVPLHFETHVSGMICLIASGARAFDDDDLRLLQILSDQAAVAIENARLLSGRDQLVHELAALLEVSEAASSASDELQLSKLLCDRIRRATRMDAAVISRWDEGSTVLRILHREGVNGTDASIDVADSPLRRAVLRDGRPAAIQADALDSTPDFVELRQMGGRTLVALPLNAGGRTIGLIELLSFQSPRILDQAEMQAAEAMASLAATGLEKVRLVEQLRSAADMDLVTGVHNHRYLQERVRQEVARSSRSHGPFALLMLDLDKFKPVNDRHGHADGDKVLHNIGATIKANVRTMDVVARYGGDEFVVLMPDTPDSQAELVARRVVNGVRSARHVMSDGSHVSVGVSGGLAVYPADGRTSTQLLLAADAAMYAAKRSGSRGVERSSPALIALASAPAAG